jgi:hypothetical protein
MTGEPEIRLGAALEGAADFFFGRPIRQNPYSEESAYDEWHSWRYGWEKASFLDDLRGDEERSRWNPRRWSRPSGGAQVLRDAN